MSFNEFLSLAASTTFAIALILLSLFVGANMLFTWSLIDLPHLLRPFKGLGIPLGAALIALYGLLCKWKILDAAALTSIVLALGAGISAAVFSFATLSTPSLSQDAAVAAGFSSFFCTALWAEFAYLAILETPKMILCARRMYNATS